MSSGGSIEGSAAFNIDQLISTSEQQNSKKQPRSLAESATLICPDGVSNMFLEVSGMQLIKDGKVFAKVLDVLITNLQSQSDRIDFYGRQFVLALFIPERS